MMFLKTFAVMFVGLIYFSVEAIFNSVELSAMQDLFLSTSGANWTWQRADTILTHWNFDGYHDPCIDGWEYLICTNDQQHIAGFNFSFNNMAGTLPDSVGNFSRLAQFDVHANFKLVGSLPESIGNLTTLNFLRIAKTSMTGILPPSIYNLTKLTVIEFTISHFTGALPRLNVLRNLTQISIGDCDFFTNVTLPEEICDSPNLRIINFNYNYWQGTIPSCYGQFSELTELSLEGNYFTGTIPTHLSNSSKLKYLFLYENLLTGTIPDLTMMDQIIYSVLDSNLLSGKLPNGMYASEYLEGFEVSFNQLSGFIPQDLVPTNTYSKALFFAMSNNMLTGTIPSILTETLLISEYFLSWNHLSGIIPALKSNLTLTIVLNNNILSGSLVANENDLARLQTLSVNDNALSGRLPVFKPMLNTFYIQNNKITGPFPGQLFKYDHSSTRYDLMFIDVSNNQLTGALPLPAFESGQLSNVLSFAAGGNCLTGSIPPSICDMTELLFLDLDGLSTASACRTPLFSHIPSIKSFLLQNTIEGGIPLCLFKMLKLQTLHISGNNIKWSISDNLKHNRTVISSSLTELSLAHNQLTGTVPDAIWDKQWVSLDLSFNKLTGVIPSQQLNTSTNTSLTLQVNRLSGPIPHKLVKQKDINILNGNFFDCDLLRTQLPIYDKAFKIFQCGSNSFNQSIIIWVSVLALIVVIMFLLTYVIVVTKLSFEWMVWLKTVFLQYVKFSTVLMQPEHSMSEFCDYLNILRKACMCMTIVICVVGLPLYATLTVFFKTLSYENTWAVSAAYLSGDIPAYILFSILLLWIFGLFLTWHYVIFDALDGDVSPNLSRQPSTSSVSNFSANRPNRIRIALLAFIILINCATILAANGGYVYVILNYNSQIIFLMQVAMALFKLCWNDFALRGMMRLARRIYSGAESRETIYGQEDVFKEMPTMTFIVLFNTIIAPCLATASVDPQCFLNALKQPATVTTTFPSISCEEIDAGFGECSDITPTGTLISLSYDPPFTYRYQCTSVILGNYASVYVFMFLFVAFFKPVLLILMNKYYQQLQSSTILHIIINNTMFNMIKPSDKAQGRFDSLLFHKERFTLRILSKLAVFFTFGVVFPPLAVVICAAVISETYLNQIVLGRFLHDIPIDVVREQFAKKLHKDCEGAMELLLLPLTTLVVSFAAVFYAFFLFDIYGDKVGAKGAVWLCVLMAATPAIIYVCYKVYLVCISNCASVKGETTKDDTVLEMTDNKMIMTDNDL